MLRRNFLRAGAMTLPLPLLEGALKGKASAAPGDPPIRLVVFVSKFGVFETNWQQTSLDPSTPLGPNAHTMPLSDFGDREINRVLGNTYRDLYPKMNLIRGLDVLSRYCGHNNSGPLCASIDDVPSEFGSCNPIRGFPIVPHSMDVVLEDNIYDTPPALGAFRVSPFLDASSSARRWLQQCFRDGAGISYTESLVAAYSQLFDDLAPTSGTPQNVRQPGLIDGALPQLNRLLRSRQLGSRDREAIESYAARLSDLRSNLARRQSVVCAAPDASVTEVDGYDNSEQVFSALNDMIVSAFSCDLTRISIVGVNQGTTNPRQVYMHPNSHCEGSFHSPEDEAYCAAQDTDSFDDKDRGFYQTYASQVFDLARKMDAIVEPNGQTMLDNSVILWTNTQGTGDHHWCNNLPVVTLGGAGGRIQTGQFLDYENRPGIFEINERYRHMGRPYNNLLTDIMRCFDLTPDHWEAMGAGEGFGEWTRGYSSSQKQVWEPYLVNKNHSLPGFLVGA